MKKIFLLLVFFFYIFFNFVFANTNYVTKSYTDKLIILICSTGSNGEIFKFNGNNIYQELINSGIAKDHIIIFEPLSGGNIEDNLAKLVAQIITRKNELINKGLSPIPTSLQIISLDNGSDLSRALIHSSKLLSQTYLNKIADKVSRNLTGKNLTDFQNNGVSLLKRINNFPTNLKSSQEKINQYFDDINNLQLSLVEIINKIRNLNVESVTYNDWVNLSNNYLTPFFNKAKKVLSFEINDILAVTDKIPSQTINKTNVKTNSRQKNTKANISKNTAIKKLNLNSELWQEFNKIENLHSSLKIKYGSAWEQLTELENKYNNLKNLDFKINREKILLFLREFQNYPFDQLKNSSLKKADNFLVGLCNNPIETVLTINPNFNDVNSKRFLMLQNFSGFLKTFDTDISGICNKLPSETSRILNELSGKIDAFKNINTAFSTNISDFSKQIASTSKFLSDTLIEVIKIMRIYLIFSYYTNNEEKAFDDIDKFIGWQNIANVYRDLVNIKLEATNGLKTLSGISPNKMANELDSFITSAENSMNNIPSITNLFDVFAATQANNLDKKVDDIIKQITALGTPQDPFTLYYKFMQLSFEIVGMDKNTKLYFHSNIANYNYIDSRPSYNVSLKPITSALDDFTVQNTIDELTKEFDFNSLETKSASFIDIRAENIKTDFKNRLSSEYKMLLSKNSLAMDKNLTMTASAVNISQDVLKSWGLNVLDINFLKDYQIFGIDLNNPTWLINILDSKFMQLDDDLKLMSLLLSQYDVIYNQAGNMVDSFNQQPKVKEFKEIYEKANEIKRRGEGSGELKDYFLVTLPSAVAIQLGLELFLQSVCGIYLDPLLKGFIRIPAVVIVSDNLKNKVSKTMSRMAPDEYILRTNQGYNTKEVIIENLYTKPQVHLSAVFEEVNASIKVTEVSSYENPTFPGLTLYSCILKDESRLSTGVLIKSDLLKKYYKQINIKTNVEKTINDDELPFYDISDGKLKSIDNLAINNNTIIIRGTLNDLTPKNCTFKYSLNFSAFNDIKIIDDKGNFEIGPLKILEGQNFLTFQAENKAGYSTKQSINFVKILTNVQPVLDTIFPQPGSVIANSKIDLKLAFQNMDYSKDAQGAKPNTLGIKSFQINNIEQVNQEAFQKSLKNYWVTTTSNIQIARLDINYPLIETIGKIEILAIATDNYGTESILCYSFFNDLLPPTVNIINRESTANIENNDKFIFNPYKNKLTFYYQVSDNYPDCLKKIFFEIYTQNNEKIYTFEIGQKIKFGKNYYVWDGKISSDQYLSPGNYIFVLKAEDQAGNIGEIKKELIIDTSIPKVTEIGFNKSNKKYNLADKTVKLNIFVDKRVNGILSVKNLNTKYITNVVFNTTPNIDLNTNKIINYYAELVIPISEDRFESGVYELSVKLADTFGNVSDLVKISDAEFVLDKDKPEFINVNISPLLFTAKDNNLTIKFNLQDKQIDVNNRKDSLTVNYFVINQKNEEKLNSTKDCALQGTSEIVIPFTTDNGLANLASGEYKIVLTANDSFGNQAVKSGSFIKQGIKPTILFPENSSEGYPFTNETLIIKGYVQDPNLTNNAKFEKFALFLVDFEPNITNFENQANVKNFNNFITIPLRHKKTIYTPKLKPNEGNTQIIANDTIGYINNFDGKEGIYYLVLAVYEEKLGITAIDYVKLNYYKQVFDTSSQLANINFNNAVEAKYVVSDKNTTIPISFNVIADNQNYYNVSVEISNSKDQVVFNRYFNNKLANQLQGSPFSNFNFSTFNTKELKNASKGLYFYRESGNKYYSLVINENQNYKIYLSSTNGNITFKNSKNLEIKNIDKSILQIYSKSTADKIGGCEIYLDSNDTISIDYITETDEKSNDFYRVNSRIYLGDNLSPVNINPYFVNIYEPDIININWYPKIEGTDNFLDSGNYTLTINLEKTDGSGLVRIEKRFMVITPFEFKLLK